VIFWKMECSPERKLRHIYDEVVEEMTVQKKKEEEEMEQFREERRRHQRMIAWQNKVDEMRRAAWRAGQEFVEPQQPDLNVSEPEE